MRHVIHRRSVGPSRQFVNTGVPQCRHLANLEDLLRVVLDTERLDAPTVDVDIVQHPVVVEPVPVLVLDRVVERSCAGACRREIFTVNGGPENGREFPVTVIGQAETVDCQRRPGEFIATQHWREDVCELNVHVTCDRGDRVRIGRQTFVFADPVRKRLDIRQVLERNRRDQYQPGRRFAVVRPGQRVLDEGCELGAKVRKPPLAFKGFVEPEERDNRVGSKTGQPVIGARKLSRAPMQLVGVETFGARKRPGCFARRMGPKSRGIAGAAQISDHHPRIRKLPVQLSLEMRKVLHPIGKAIADEHDPLAGDRLLGMNPGCSEHGNDQCQLHTQRPSYALKAHSLPFAPNRG